MKTLLCLHANLDPRVGSVYMKGGPTWTEAGWTPVREPVTITFHPPQ